MVRTQPSQGWYTGSTPVRAANAFYLWKQAQINSESLGFHDTFMTEAQVKEHDVPDVLYRGFEVLEHARAFVDEGIIRFGRLDLYCNLEDPHRRDPGEEIARLRMPMPDSQDVADVIPTECKGRNWTYLLCASAADQGYVASKFGRYVVRP